MQAQSVWKDLEQVRQKNPLVHSITNYVVMNNTANALLAVGASPIMAHAEEEMEEMVGIVNTLVLNIGTLSPPWIRAMHKAGETALRLQKPIILDPVGAGATSYRTQTALELIRLYKPSVIRGNASEIKALAAQEYTQTKGVDSTDASEAALEAARFLHNTYGSTVCISGASDWIVGEGIWIRIDNGHPLMTKVTGMGCTATALIGAFAGVNSNFSEAASHAMAVMGIAGEKAAAQAQGNGTMQLHFLDALGNLNEQTLSQALKAETLRENPVTSR